MLIIERYATVKLDTESLLNQYALILIQSDSVLEGGMDMGTEIEIEGGNIKSKLDSMVITRGKGHWGEVEEGKGR